MCFELRAATFIALIIGVLLLAGGIALGERERSRKRLDVEHALTNTVSQEVEQLEDYFDRARSTNLLTARNPGFRDFYAGPGNRVAKVKAHGRALRRAEDALAYLEQLYPTSIGEACFIDRTGPENARYVRGVRATYADLSPDESGNPFFKPTFALRPGQIYQATPYVSPDTHEWVISNSTPLPGTGFPPIAIVHFEITLESFRRQAAISAGGNEIAIVEASTGRVVIDSRFPQRRGAPLGRPNDRRFSALLDTGRKGGTATLEGHRSAYRRLRRTPHNANDWMVVAMRPQHTATLLEEVGGAPLGMAGAGLLLLFVAGISLRASRKMLHSAAHTDSLTGLRNRRQLLFDLDHACQRARPDERFALVLFDLDGFKSYNDNFGHLPGDALLRRLAQKLAETVVDWGNAYRLGGDEFCVLASLRGQEPADGVAALGAEALSEEGEGFVIGCSYGSVLLPDEAQTPSDLLATADVRMYASKEAGRRSAARQTTDALVRAQHERSPLLGPHVSHVYQVAEAVGKRLGISEHQLLRLRQAAELHDVGKIAIPDAVLNKPGSLTKDEWRLVREHTTIGERIVSAAPALRYVAKIVRATHERFDGHGYPDGLAGEEIPLEARIVGAADAFCAMTTNRPYGVARTIDDAFAELQRCAGGQFDPAIVEALIAVVREWRKPPADSAETYLPERPISSTGSRL